MVNKKEVLDADKQMHEIIESLEKMKKATKLLSDAEHDNSLVVSTSKEIIEKISPFIASGEKTLKTLDKFNVKDEIKSLESSIKDINKKNELSNENHSLKFDRLKDQISSARAKSTDQFKSILDKNKLTSDNLKKIVSEFDKEVMEQISTIKSLLTFVLFAVLGIGVYLWLFLLP